MTLRKFLSKVQGKLIYLIKNLGPIKAQKGQDLWVIGKIFPFKRNGYFLDLAAADGVRHSNTYLLERVFGWNGICIEPNPEFFRRLQKSRKCIVDNSVVSEKEELVEFRIDNGQLGGIVSSDTDNNPATRASQLSNADIIKLNATTLTRLLDRLGAPRVIDYFSLDVEGSEERIIRSLDFKKYQFRCLTIERPTPKVNDILFKNGYLFVKNHKYDSFYIHGELVGKVKIKLAQFAQVPKKGLVIKDLFVLTRLAKKQNEFHLKINKYVNGAEFSKVDVLLGFLDDRFPIAKHSERILSEFSNLEALNVGDDKSCLAVQVQPYKGEVEEVWKISKELKSIEEHLAFVGVHGSLGTDDIVYYSDFDALVILRASVFQSTTALTKVAQTLNRCRGYMYQFDPLQHHGWFVLSEYDLENYCESYFPVELFKYTKSILSLAPMGISFQLRNSQAECSAAFLNLRAKIISTNFNQIRNDLYQLKSFVSKVLLVPAVYLQALTGKGVYKKESFELIGDHFEKQELHALERASLIRKEWPLVSGFKKSRIYANGVVPRKIILRCIKIKPPEELTIMLDEFFYSSLEGLLTEMANRLASTP